MRLTSIPPPDLANSHTQAETLSSLCNWWMTTKEEALPGICHWFLHPHKNQPRFSLSFQQNQSLSNSSFSSIGYSGNVNMLDMDHPIHSTASISLILIIGGGFFILLVGCFITCITRKKRVQNPNEDEFFMNQRVSEHIQMRIRARSQKKDQPPNYVSVVKMKEEEDEELPSYSEAINTEAEISEVTKADDNGSQQ